MSAIPHISSPLLSSMLVSYHVISMHHTLLIECRTSPAADSVSCHIGSYLHEDKLEYWSQVSGVSRVLIY